MRIGVDDHQKKLICNFVLCLSVHLFVRTHPSYSQWIQMSASGGRNITSLSLYEREKNVWIFRQILASSWAHADRPNIYSPLFRPPARHSSREREGERWKERERVTFLIGCFFPSEKASWIQVHCRQHTHAPFCVLWQILLFCSCMEQERIKWREKRRGWKEKEEKRERPHRVFLPSWCERRPPQSPCVISSPSEFRY